MKKLFSKCYLKLQSSPIDLSKMLSSAIFSVSANSMTETSSVRQRIVRSIHRGASCSASVGFGILPLLIGAKSDVMPNAAETARVALAVGRGYHLNHRRRLRDNDGRGPSTLCMATLDGRHRLGADAMSDTTNNLSICKKVMNGKLLNSVRTKRFGVERLRRKRECIWSARHGSCICVATGNGCDFSQSARALSVGSIPVLCHQAASSP
jgi:hypothetical protein